MKQQYTVAEMKSERGCFKFVCVDDQYRFFSHHHEYSQHLQLGEVATSAGSFGVGQYLITALTGSIMQECWQGISDLFDLPVCDEFGDKITPHVED